MRGKVNRSARLLTAWILCAFLPAAGWARSFQATTPAATSGRLVEIATAREIAWGRAVDPTDRLDPDATSIYVWFRHDGLAAGATVSAVWFFEGQDPPRRIAEATQVVKPPADWGQFSIELPPGTRWPIGKYRVELRVGDTRLGEARFTIADAVERAAASPSAPASYTNPRFGFTIVVPDGWAVDASAQDSTVLKRRDGNGLIEIAAGPTSLPLDPVSYAAGWESVSVGPGKRLTARTSARKVTVDGDAAFEGTYDGEGVVVRVVFLAKPDRFFVVTAVAPRGDTSAFGDFDRLLASFATRGR
jgi:hypothetical protein